MALTTTTLASQTLVTDNSIVVTSATGFTPGSLVRIDGEGLRVATSYVSGTTIPVLRGQDGTATTTHRSGANVTVGTAGDFATPAPQTVVGMPVQPALPVSSYSASGAISPAAGIVQLNGTSALAMTLAGPGKDQDGALLTLVSNGKAAHTVTVTGGLGGGGGASDVLTFSATQQQAVTLVASNGTWALVGGVAAAATVAGVGVA
jgi:hypothetical protein